MRIWIIILLFVAPSVTFGQFDPNLAFDLYEQGNFQDAIPEFKKHLKLDRNNGEILVKLANCYLETNKDKAKAAIYLEKAVALDKIEKEAYYYLGLAYTHTYEYDKAVEALNKYLEKPGKHADEVPGLIRSFQFAKELYEHPKRVTFKNLGKLINSEYPDYYPFVSKSEEVLVFTSRREEGKGAKEFDGYYPSDIYVVHYDGIRFTKAKPSGSMNSSFDEQCVGIYDDGSKIFVYIDNITEVGDIYEAIQTGPIFGKKRKIKEGVNTKYIEVSASISSDENTLFYSSDRPGGKGKFDLYMTRKLPNGDWATPQNLSQINTPGNELFPSLSPDGKTLYFSSDSLPGLGGYDLYKSEWNEESNQFSKPVNLGYPINSSYDDRTICFADNHKHAYISAVRPEGYGDWDIYRLTMEDVNLDPVLYLVQVVDAGTLKKINGANMIIYDQFDEIIGEYVPNKTSQQFTVMLEPGEYSIEVDSPEYGLHVQKFVVSEFDGDNGINKKTIKIAK